MATVIDRSEETHLTYQPKSNRYVFSDGRFSAAVHDLCTTAAIANWEIRAYFRRPTAYVLLMATTLVAGWNFLLLVTLLSQGRVVVLRQADDPLAQFLGPNIFLILSLMLVLPVVTMGLVADERRRGTWETLLTAPIQPWQAIVGKFAAAWCAVMVNILPWICYLAILYFYAGLDFDAGHLIGGAVGIGTVSLTLCAIGLFCSTICRAPFAAAVSTGAAMLGLLLLSLLPRAMEYWWFDEQWISWAKRFACWEHLAQFSRGAIDLSIVSGHLSVAVIFLWLAIQVSQLRD